ncbi:MAG: hypothetical protein H5U17_04175 [Defluviimonas sp.]|nr:hypothetical protein [Defluviimonas sp.]
MKEASFPYQQGSLDCLCSVYAVINLLHLRKKIRSVSGAGKVFKEFSKSRGFELATRGGVWPKDFLEFTGPVFKARNLQCENVKDPGPESLLMRAKSGAIIFFKNGNGFDHYTVIRTTNSLSHVELFDSYGFATIQCDRGVWLIDGEKITIRNLFAVDPIPGKKRRR